MSRGTCQANWRPRQEAVNANYEVRNPTLEELVESLPNEQETGIAWREIKIRAPLGTRDNEITDALVTAGFRRRKVRANGKRENRWFPPPGFVGGGDPPEIEGVVVLRPVDKSGEDSAENGTDGA